MCYSAQVEASFAAYRKMTGAQIDIAQFEEIYGLRLADPSIKIARSVDRWFREPNSEGEWRIHDMIEKHRAEQVTKIEGEIFAQKRRLADAERKLSEKPTKAAAESQRIATDKIEKA